MLSIQHAMCLALHNEKADSKLVAATLYPDAIRAYSGPRQYSHFEKSESGKFSYESEELDEEPLDEESSIDYDNDDFEI